MRRALIAGFLVGALAAGIALCTEFGKRSPAPAERAQPEAAAEAEASPSGAPRLATAPPDAGRTRASGPAEAQAILAQIHALVRTDPERAEALARESRRSFADGPAADERDALLVDALINQQRIGRARDETYYYFDHHPNGRFAEHLFIMTGVHPRPRGPSSPR